MPVTMSPKKWAVLVGIDYYDRNDVEKNLDGCVTDVQNVSEFIQGAPLEVPPENITTLVAPMPSQHGIEKNSKMPTRDNIIAALKEVADDAHAQPGDFVLFHFSGHGDFCPTIYGKHKSDTGVDEVLCTTLDQSGDIRDVELGELLDAMVKKGLVVLAVIDCCHSGGVTRGNRGKKVRCRMLRQATAREGRDSNLKGTASNARGAKRNVLMKESSFYRHTEYNVIAACQPDQSAREYKDPKGDVHGALTYCLIESLKSFSKNSTSSNDSTLPITYTTLYGVLESKRLQIGATQQQPMMLGEANRIVFGTALDPPTRTAIITHTGESLTLIRGSASGVCVNDLYKVYRPWKSFLGTGFNPQDEVAEVVINEVRGLHSKAALSNNTAGHLQDVDAGWPAVLVQRASVVHVRCLPVPEHSDPSATAAFNHLQQYWQLYNSGIVQFNFHFENDPCEATFQISINQDCCFEIRDSQGTILPSIPPLKVDAPQISKRVFVILQHVHSYQMLEGLKPPTNFKHHYEFSIKKAEAPPVEADNGSATEVWASREVIFENRSNVDLFVTILNLSPAWGVHQIFPYEDPESVKVQPSKGIPEAIIDMIPPKLWETIGTTAPREMRDVLKLFITTEQTSFSHYLLPNLDDPTSETMKQDTARRARARPPTTDNWFVHEMVIITKKTGQL